MNCPVCKRTLEYTHRDGVSVCKCPDKKCAGYERWLEPEEFADYWKTPATCEECDGTGLSLDGEINPMGYVADCSSCHGRGVV
jgi:DnaJ-class molecular chaperone